MSAATRRPTARRKVVAVTVAALGIAGLGLASAAQLTVTPTALGAGTSVVASCDTAVKVGFTNNFSISDKGYVVNTVKLTDIAKTCAGQTVTVDLLDASPDAGTGTVLATYGGTVGTDGGELVVSRTGAGTAVKASAVQGAAVVITG